MKSAKNTWFQKKAEEIEKDRFGGKQVWRCIRDMQCGRRGLLPLKIVTICDEEGAPCLDIEAQHQHWNRHFATVLNVANKFSANELELVRQRDRVESFDDLTTCEDVVIALDRIKNGKAAGSSGILPDMLKVGSNVAGFMHMPTDLVHAVWKEHKLPKEWENIILIPIPKKEIYTFAIIGGV